MKNIKKYIHLISASVLLASLTACSQQQVAAQPSDSAKATVKDHICRGCNAPKIEPIIKPTPKPIAAAPRAVKRPVPVPKPQTAYQPRQHVPTVPNKKNASSALVRRIQNALTAKGYNPGATDGTMGTRTSAALSAFQAAKGLPTGGINQPTLRALGIK